VSRADFTQGYGAGCPAPARCIRGGLRNRLANRPYTARLSRRWTSHSQMVGVRAERDYFGTTCWLPPGVPGGGITGMLPSPRCGSGLWMPGSIAGGCRVPRCCDSLSLRV
jgi:hypothetical protein